MGRLTYMRQGFRRDIEGLRAIAVLLVLLYHSGLPFVSGGYVGVDVFFVLSGFLITGILVRELEETGTIRLLDFYAKRARRLLPASFTVLVFIAAVLFIVPRWLPEILAPQIYGRSISWDIQRSALYIVNWLFAERSVDYHGGTDLASPLQHFWSLSVEEQFYAVWPLLLLSVSVLSRRSTKVLTAVLTTITCASLFMSYRLTKDVPAQAYFVTTTRVWELSLGGLAALGLPALQRSTRWKRNVAPFVFPIGGAAIIVSAIALDESTHYPGLIALAPTLGTVAVLLAGSDHNNSHITKVLSASPMQWIGARSYSLYLWHWPMLWLATSIAGQLSPVEGLAVVAFSFLPAIASYRFVEQPARTARFLSVRPMRGVLLTAGTAAAGYAVGMALLITTTNLPISINESTSAQIETEVAGVQLEIIDELMPPIVSAYYDKSSGYEDGCIGQRADTSFDPCSFGNTDSETSVMIIGNSHAGHWLETFRALAVRNDWHLVSNIRSGCRLPEAIAGPLLCEEWSRSVQDELPAVIDNYGVDLVIIIENSMGGEAISDDVVRTEYLDTYRSLRSVATDVVVFRPTPRGDVIGVGCPPLIRSDLSACARPVSEAMVGSAPILAAAAEAGLSTLDMTGYFCNEQVCPAVIDDVLVRRDEHHLTRTFALSLTSALEGELERFNPELTAR